MLANAPARRFGATLRLLRAIHSERGKAGGLRRDGRPPGIVQCQKSP